MPQFRQLAAIMFTDIVGYTSLMGDDEEEAFELLKQNRELQKPLIEKFSGKWIKEIGDAVLASFLTVTDAVLCATEIQHSSHQFPKLNLRIGIHQGEVVFENEDVFGDGVNIASRIQAIAKPGGIYISESVHNNISNKQGIETKFIKLETLKNVKAPVKIYEVITNGESSQLKIKEQVKNLPAKSIAVLPFINMSSDPDQEYFSEGIAEEILNSLAHVKDLKVAGRTSSYQFKGKNIDLREVGDKLGVSTVLEGSVRKQGNHLRITAQLINVEDGFQIWSERYDRDLDDIFAIQDEIAVTITEKLKITLLDTERAFIKKTPTINKEAYDNYLRGRFFWKKRGSGLKKGLEYFLLAAEIDPLFALAHAGIADSYSLLAFYSVIPPHNAMPKAKKAAETAIDIDDSLVEAWTSLAFISMLYDWDWDAAKRQFQKAFAINNNYAPTHDWYSTFVSWVENKPEDAVKESTRAAELEPLVAISYNLLANTLLCAGRFTDAVVASNTAVELEPNSFLAYWFLGVSYIGLEKYTEAIAVLQTAVNISNRHAWPLAELCNAFALTGKIVEAQKILDELISRSATEFISGMFLFIPAYALKEYDLAFEYLEKGFEQRDGTLPGCRAWPGFTPMKHDSRFQSIIERMNFPES